MSQLRQRLRCAELPKGRIIAAPSVPVQPAPFEISANPSASSSTFELRNFPPAASPRSPTAPACVQDGLLPEPSPPSRLGRMRLVETAPVSLTFMASLTPTACSLCCKDFINNNGYRKRARFRLYTPLEFPDSIPIFPKLVLFAICLAPVAYIFFQIVHQKRKRHLESKSPFSGLLMRPAGEGVRLKIQELYDGLDDYYYKAITAPLLLGGFFFLLFHGRDLSLPEFAVAAVGVIAAVGTSFGIWGRRIPSMIRDYELGFQGERYVGEELNQLLKDGFRVFHDLEFDDFNIDHVVVGQSGVYAIETKTRRKTIGEKGKAENKVVFDGARLNFPWGWDTHGLEQAKRNADYLATWLSSATGEKVKVEAILTLPGWWVERTGRNPVHVVNTKEIPKIFITKPPILSPEQIQRICHQIEQKCRNLKV